MPQANPVAPSAPQGAPAPPLAFGEYQGAPAPGGYPGAPVPPPLAASSPRKQVARGLLANVGIRVGILVVIAAIGGAVAFFTNAGRDSSGNINKAGDVPVSDLRLGDCYDLQGDIASVEKTTGIPCDQPHHYEVFYTGTMSSLTAAPTSSDVDTWAAANCAGPFADYVGIPYDQSTLGITVFYPDSSAWESGDRSAQCSLQAQDKQAITGSMKGSKR